MYIDEQKFDKFEQKKKLKKIRAIENNCFDWLINHIPEPIAKTVDGFKDKFVNLFKTNTPKQTMCGTGKKLSKPKTLRQKKQKSKIE